MININYYLRDDTAVMLAECEMWSIHVMDANLSVSWIIRVLRTDANSVVESVASSTDFILFPLVRF